jgi:MoaA/NifB/PqqE/SkfB family radical SAM enzyme
MSQSAYSPLKAAWHLDTIEGMRVRAPVAPVELQLIISDLCNHDCHFCAYRASEGLSSAQFGENGNMNPNRMIPYEKCLEILEDAAHAGVKSVIFTGGGEPTVHPEHMEIFKHAIAIGMECSLNTNGHVLRKGWEEILPYFTYIRFSIDAGSPEEYAEVRKVSENVYHKVLKNLHDVADECRNEDCTVGTGYVVAPTSAEHLYQGVRNIREAGADYVRLASMQSKQGLAAYDGKLREVREAIEFAKTLETDDFKVVDLFDIAQGEKVDDPACGFQHFVVYIGGNQKVYRCCYTAYTELGECGDLKDMTFYDWLKESSLERYDFDARQCGTCQLWQKNRTINYLTVGEPKHVNFV